MKKPKIDENVATLKLKLICDSESADKLASLMSSGYMTAMQYVIDWQWNNGKTSSRKKVQPAVYDVLRTQFNLKSQLAISAINKSLGVVDSWWKLVKAGQRKKSGELPNKPVMKKTSVRLDNNRAITINLVDEKASITTPEGRAKVQFFLPKYYYKYLGWDVGSSELCVKNNQLYLHVSVNKPLEEFEQNDIVVGYDLGEVNPAVSSDNQFYGEKYYRDILNKKQTLKSELKSKGTKSSMRKLKALDDSENRFKNNTDHILSKRIVDNAPTGSTLVFEDLSTLTEGMKKSSDKRSKELNRRLFSFTFGRLLRYIIYKGKLKGLRIFLINPAYTSQKCSKCGHIHKNNRVSQGSFVCQKCGFSLNADINAARNIRDEYLVNGGISAIDWLCSQPAQCIN